MADGETFEQVGVRLPPSAVRELERIVAKDGATTMGQLLRKWILDRLEKEKR